MCHDENSSVPLAPGDQGNVTRAELELSTSDGNAYPAYLASPERPAGPPVVLLPDAGGLHSFYKELADRFAGLGSRRSRSTTTAVRPSRPTAKTGSNTGRTSGNSVARPCCSTFAGQWSTSPR